MASEPLFNYTTDRLSRMAHLRRDAEWLQRLWTAPHRLWALSRGKPLLTGAGDAPRLLPPSLVEPLIASGAPYVLLGEDQATETSVLVVDVSDHPLPEAGLAGGQFQDLRPFALALPAHDAAMLSYARSLFVWHRSALFCGGCGSATELVDHGHARRCSNAEHGELLFPRINPAVIMVVSCGDHVVIARAPHYPPGLHSVLAGYIEHGETIEQATVREVAEEVGLIAPARDVRYLCSQPWPYSNSLMLGTLLEVSPGPEGGPPPLVVDRDELADARWYHHQDLLAAEQAGRADRSFYLPPRDAVARQLIDHWLLQRQQTG